MKKIRKIVSLFLLILPSMVLIAILINYELVPKNTTTQEFTNAPERLILYSIEEWCDRSGDCSVEKTINFSTDGFRVNDITFLIETLEEGSGICPESFFMMDYRGDNLFFKDGREAYLCVSLE